MKNSANEDIYLESIKKKYEKLNNTILDSDSDLLKVARSANKKRKAGLGAGFKQKVTYDHFRIFLPEGMEETFIFIYIVFLPYFTGLLFMFFYVSKGKFDIFKEIWKDHSYILTWCVGYEIVAIFLLLYIFKLAFSSIQIGGKKGKRIYRPD